MKIKQAENGFAQTTDDGRVFVYKTLTELAAAIEGPSTLNYNGTVYSPGHDLHSLREFHRLMEQNRKIDAIKLVRDIYTPRMGLKEAKELAEFIVT